MIFQRIMISLTVVFLLLALPGFAIAEDTFVIEGKYLVEGWDPGNAPIGTPDYRGRAMLTKWGETWRYHAVIDDMTYAGAALYDPQCGALSLSFTNGDGSERGVTHLRIEGDILEGKWVLDNGGSGKPGYEIWTRE